jgi:hypothetical protein
MGNGGRVPLQLKPTGGPDYPLNTAASNIATAPPVIIAGAPILQTLGVFSGTLVVPVEAIAAGDVQDVTFQIPLTTFPSPFTLLKSATGLILASVLLQSPPSPATCVVGLPALSLFFKNGLQLTPGSGTWTIRPGVQYSGPTLQAVLRIGALKDTGAQKITVLAQAHLVGIPA